MISKTLTKLIDEAILPTVVLVGAKVLGIIFVNYKFNLNWQYTSTGLVYTSRKDFVLANSYSSIIMFLVVVFGLVYVVLKAYFFHDTHISPYLSAKLRRYKLDFLIRDTLGIYSQSVVWLSYTWLITAILSVQASFGLVYAWIAYLAIITSILSTVFLLLDIEKEILSSLKEEGVIRSPIDFSDIASLLKSR